MECLQNVCLVAHLLQQETAQLEQRLLFGADERVLDGELLLQQREHFLVEQTSLDRVARYAEGGLGCAHLDDEREVAETCVLLDSPQFDLERESATEATGEGSPELLAVGRRVREKHSQEQPKALHDGEDN